MSEAVEAKTFRNFSKMQRQVADDLCIPKNVGHRYSDENVSPHKVNGQQFPIASTALDLITSATFSKNILMVQFRLDNGKLWWINHYGSAEDEGREWIAASIQNYLVLSNALIVSTVHWIMVLSRFLLRFNYSWSFRCAYRAAVKNYPSREIPSISSRFPGARSFVSHLFTHKVVWCHLSIQNRL